MKNRHKNKIIYEIETLANLWLNLNCVFQWCFFLKKWFVFVTALYGCEDRLSIVEREI